MILVCSLLPPPVEYAQIDWHDFVIVETISFRESEAGMKCSFWWQTCICLVTHKTSRVFSYVVTHVVANPTFQYDKWNIFFNPSFSFYLQGLQAFLLPLYSSFFLFSCLVTALVCVSCKVIYLSPPLTFQSLLSLCCHSCCHKPSFPLLAVWKKWNFNPSFSFCIAGNFWGRKLSWIFRFCGYLRKFSPLNLGAWDLWRGKSEQSMKVFSAKIVFFTNLLKLSPSKVSRYTVPSRVTSLSASSLLLSSL